jgi:hypothetical protein
MMKGEVSNLLDEDVNSTPRDCRYVLGRFLHSSVSFLPLMPAVRWSLTVKVSGLIMSASTTATRPAATRGSSN